MIIANLSWSWKEKFAVPKSFPPAAVSMPSVSVALSHDEKLLDTGHLTYLLTYLHCIGTR